MHGLTGHIEFNEGKRSNFKIDLLKLKREQIQKVGHWSPADGINVTDPTAFYETNATNITLIVMTREVSLLAGRWVLCIMFICRVCRRLLQNMAAARSIPTIFSAHNEKFSNVLSWMNEHVKCAPSAHTYHRG